MPTAAEVFERIRSVMEAVELNPRELEVEGMGTGLIVEPPGFEGANKSTFVGVRCAEPEEGKVLVFLFAPVLSGIRIDDPEIAGRAIVRVNELNVEASFGRWVFYMDHGTIDLEHEMLGDDLGERAIIAAVTSIGQMADEVDEELQRELGGKRAIEGDADPPSPDSV